MATLSNFGLKSVLDIQALSSSTNGAAVDMQGSVFGRRSIKGVLMCLPTGGDANETCDVKFQESNTTVSGDFVDITGASFSQVTQPGGASTQQINFPLRKRYIRAVVTLAGTTPTFTVGVAVIAPNSQ